MGTILEVGIYKKQDLAQLTGIDPNSQKAKRDMVSWLERNGYKVQHDRRHCIEILESPKPCLERDLQLYLEDKFNLSSKEFMCHLYMICNDRNYCMTPNKTRMKILKECFNIDVSEQTISGSWNKKLVEIGLLKKSKMNDSRKWFSCWIDGERYQEEIADDNQDWKQYWKDFYIFMKEDSKTARKRLNSKYGGCYFPCREFALTAWGFQSEFLDMLNKVVEENYLIKREEV